MDKKVIGAVFLGSMFSLVVSLFFILEAHKDLTERMGENPPVVVVDFAQIAQSYPEGATPEEVEALMVKTNNAILKLKEAGYLVLDAGKVIAAPDDVFLPAEFVQ